MAPVCHSDKYTPPISDVEQEILSGLNIKPHSQITIRPEVKYDWSPGGQVAADGNLGFNNANAATIRNGSEETTFSVDVIFTF